MAYTKKALKSKPVCKVRFKVTADETGGSDELYLVGSFNEWDERKTPMKKGKDGSFSVEVDLPQGERHMFRYLRPDGAWFSDSTAEGYENCVYTGAKNSLIQL